MLRNKETLLKKAYSAPQIRVDFAEPAYILATSEIDQERYNFLCPHIPETRCIEYNLLVRHNRGIVGDPLKVPEYQRIFLNVPEECPLKGVCKAHKVYLELINGKQH